MRTMLLAACLLLSGCLSSGPAPTDPEWSSPADPIPVEPVDLEACQAAGGVCHDHRDPAQHRFARNATLVGFDDLQRFGASRELVVGAHALDVHEGLLAVAVNAGEAQDGQQGFHLFDISTPGILQHRSFWEAGVAVNGDRTIAFAPAGDVVFLGFESGPRPGVAAVDISDPEAPEEVAFWSDPAGYGPHTITAANIDGETYVFVLSLGVSILRYDGAFTLVSKFITQDEAGALDALGLLDPGQPDPARTFAIRSLYGHDMTVYHDEGKDLLLVAYAYDGAKIVDVSDPQAPVLQASWLPPRDTTHRHYTHSMTAERIDGKLVVVVGSETFEPANQGIASPIWILDATQAVDAAPRTVVPEHIGTWRNPGEAPAGDLGLSVHFFRQQDGFLYLSHYHGGVWAFDLREEAGRTEPEAFAYIMPLPETATVPPEGCCIGFDLDGAPMVFDVAVDARGIVYSADIIQGVGAIELVRPG